MQILLSPAKKLEAKGIDPRYAVTEPVHAESAAYLAGKLKKKSVIGLQRMMDISKDLAQLNHERFQAWAWPHDGEESTQAALIFQGDVYQGLQAADFTKQQMAFAQKHISILSGLYGLLRPLDVVLPYRLEMGSKFAVTPKKNNLYKYWGSDIRTALEDRALDARDEVILNLASNEYSKAAELKKTALRVIEVDFLEAKGKDYRMVSFFAKKARGLMARFIVQHGITEPEDAKAFDTEGYLFNEARSQADHWVFTREEALSK